MAIISKKQVAVADDRREVLLRAGYSLDIGGGSIAVGPEKIILTRDAAQGFAHLLEVVPGGDPVEFAAWIGQKITASTSIAPDVPTAVLIARAQLARLEQMATDGAKKAAK